MATPGSSEVLSQIVADLRSKNFEVQTRASFELRAYVTNSSRELSKENTTKLLNDVNRRIFDLIHSQDNNDRIGGILAIDKLIDYTGEESHTKITRFANYLRKVLPGNDPRVMALAARALGRLAAPGGSLTSELVKFEVKRAIEWLQGDRNENRRHAAVLVLKELAENAPIIIYIYIPTILELIWVALRDSKAVIRESAAETLSSCFEIMYQRENQSQVHWYRQILEESHKGLRLGTIEAVHGSLLAYRELLLHTGPVFMQEHYATICTIIMKFKDHKDGLIRKTVIGLFPALAVFNPTSFISSMLSPCMEYLRSQLKKDREKSTAYIAIGKVAMAVGHNIAPYVELITQTMKEGLSLKNRNRSANESSIYDCISMLARAVGQALTKHMHELLDLMFAADLTDSLRKALVDLAEFLPPLLPVIQDRLLNMLSLILSGKPYKQPGAPDRDELPTAGHVSIRDIQVRNHKLVSTLQPDTRDNETIALALSTLGSFDFTGHKLTEFVRDCVISYLEDDDVFVRKAAAVACCQVFRRDPICFSNSSHAIQVVEDVLEKLLTVGIADPDPKIRQTVLASLDNRFDRHLAQAENIRSLFVALTDEVFAIREIAIMIIGRLAVHNPAHVTPLLRTSLVQLLTELESGVSRSKEESAQLLCHVVSLSKTLVRPHIEPILNVLLPLSRDSNPRVASSILNSLAELAQVACEDFSPYLAELMPVIIDTLQDQSSSSKRFAALHALGQVSSCAGFVIEPYTRYPHLLDVLIGILKSEQSSSIRKETMRVMGIIGAIDPYRLQTAVNGSDDGAVPEAKGALYRPSAPVTN